RRIRALHSRRPLRARCARRARARVVGEDERRRWHPRPRPDRAPLELRGHVRVRRALVASARAGASGRGDDRVAEEEAAARLLDGGRARARAHARRPVRARAARQAGARACAQGAARVILAVDWVAVSSITTAAATLVLAVATFAAVRSANRSARIAEQSLLAGLRPLLMPAHPEDPEQKVAFMGEKWFHLGGGEGLAVADQDGIYIAMSVRNVGSGI